ncbi:MAG TPA: SusC/RagA family TonB-linked outer membrane protein, partial [Cyclobacteriaceae bacterium]|nr:SusC/RagA family TonB-linked outer membrane protein [Cyclobacteriaceae bacterium]
MKKYSTIYWRIMRITLVQAALAMTFFGVSLAHDDFGQGVLDTEVSAEFQSQSLKSVLISIEKQTAVKFAYSGSIVNLDEKISLKADHKKLSEILEELLSPRNISFEEKNDYILLTPVAVLSGKVTDSNSGAGLPGVSILVKGTASGTTTDSEGKFSINAASGDFLIFSFIGYKTLELPVSDKTSYDVKLEEDVATLSEVVVSGYMTQSKAEFTGSAASVNVANLNRPVASFDQALSGQAAGVSVISSGGGLNAAPVFRIRGTNSIQLSSYPLIIIDGITSFTGDVGNSAENNPLSTLNPNDIESMEILKDASATAIYGSRAANGVVVITTKKGKQGNAKVTYEGWVGINTKPIRLPKTLGAEDYVMIKNEALTNAGLAPAFFLQEKPDGSGIVETNWNDLMYQTGTSQNHNVNVSGATDATSYFVSVGYTDQEGFMVKNTFDRTSVRVNLTHKLNKRLSIGTNFSYSNSLNSNLTQSGSFSLNNLAREAMVLPPNLSPYNPDGSYNMVGNSIGYGANTLLTGYYNPQPMVEHDKYTSQSGSLQGLVFAELEILKGLKVKTNYSLNDLNTVNEGFSNPYQGGGFSSNGSATSSNNRNHRTDWTNTLTYNTTIARHHNISALVGTESIYTENSGFGVTRQQLSDRFFESFAGAWNTTSSSSSSYSETAFRSFFANGTYDFKKKYLLSASFRRDGYSGLSEGNKYGNFGGGSVGWNISEENFFQSSSL